MDRLMAPRHLGLVGHQLCGHRLHALAVARQQQAGEIVKQPALARRIAQHGSQSVAIRQKPLPHLGVEYDRLHTRHMDGRRAAQKIES